jgi:hypothetical protein
MADDDRKPTRREALRNFNDPAAISRAALREIRRRQRDREDRDRRLAAAFERFVNLKYWSPDIDGPYH